MQNVSALEGGEGARLTAGRRSRERRWVVVAGWVPVTGSQLLLAKPKLRVILTDFNLKLIPVYDYLRTLFICEQNRRRTQDRFRLGDSKAPRRP